jgi:hypothetical protein
VQAAGVINLVDKPWQLFDDGGQAPVSIDLTNPWLVKSILTQIRLARQFAQTHPPLQKVQDHLLFALQTELPRPCHSPLSSKPARPLQSSAPYLSNFCGALQSEVSIRATSE